MQMMLRRQERKNRTNEIGNLRLNAQYRGKLKRRVNDASGIKRG